MRVPRVALRFLRYASLEHLLLFRYRRRCLFLPGSRTGTSALASGPLDREFKLEQERNGTYETTFTPPRGGRRVRRASGLPADCLWRGDHRGDPVCCTGIPRTADGAGCGGNPHRDGCGGQRVEVPAELSRIAVTPLPWSSVIYAIDGTSEHMVSINPGAMTAYTNCFSPSWTAVMRSWTPPASAPTSPSTWRKWSAEASRLW